MVTSRGRKLVHHMGSLSTHSLCVPLWNERTCSHLSGSWNVKSNHVIFLQTPALPLPTCMNTGHVTPISNLGSGLEAWSTGRVIPTLSCHFYRSVGMDRKHLTKDLTHSYDLHVCVPASPPHAYVEILTPSGAVLGGMAFRR